jgi:hypothetical protein
VKAHLTKLLEDKIIYWKQRSAIRFVKFGDENTNVFYSMATHTRRKNHISQFFLQDGSCVIQHVDKVAALWDSYKERLGVSIFEKIHYDIADLIPAIQLLELDYPFTEEEMQLALKGTPNDHAPGLDDLNGLFLKRCWNIINDDYKIFSSRFFNGSTNLSHLNGSYITLVPKIDNPKTPSDYMPISLLSSSMKLVTKLLSTRLQSVIQSVIH